MDRRRLSAGLLLQHQISLQSAFCISSTFCRQRRSAIDLVPPLLPTAPWTEACSLFGVTRLLRLEFSFQPYTGYYFTDSLPRHCHTALVTPAVASLAGIDGIWFTELGKGNTPSPLHLRNAFSQISAFQWFGSPLLSETSKPKLGTPTCPWCFKERQHTALARVLTADWLPA